jgi:predicted O-methyltransferase YrrM
MFNTGIVSSAKGWVDFIRFGEINYSPKKLIMPARLIKSRSQAWVGLEQILQDIIDFSAIETNSALEFGVEFGYSSSALSNYFKEVIGVDIFTGDSNAGFYGDIFELTKENLKDFNNIQLIRADYRDYIKQAEQKFDLIHVDIIHTYEDTYACGLWSVQHSNCTIFHDTQTYPDVKKAVVDIAKKTNKKFYNYRRCNGLGILI